MASSARATPDSEARALDVGDSVLIAGLSSAEGAALNGQFGIVTRPANAKGRVEVSVAGTFVRLSPANARRLAFDIGARVQARGLDSEWGGALSGRVGTVLGYTPMTDCFQVYFAQGGTVSLRAASLSLVVPSASAQVAPEEGAATLRTAGAQALAENEADAAASCEAAAPAPAAEEPAQATTAEVAATATLAVTKSPIEACPAPAAAVAETGATTSAPPPRGQGGKPSGSVDRAEPEVQGKAAPEVKPPAELGHELEANTKPKAQPDAQAAQVEAKPPARRGRRAASGDHAAEPRVDAPTAHFHQAAQEVASPEPDVAAILKATPTAKRGRKPAAGRLSPAATKQKRVAEKKAQTAAAEEAPAKKQCCGRPAKAATGDSASGGRGGAAQPEEGVGGSEAAETLERSEAFEEAVRFGVEGALRKLASREELSGRGFSPDQLLVALLKGAEGQGRTARGLSSAQRQAHAPRRGSTACRDFPAASLRHPSSTGAAANWLIDLAVLWAASLGRRSNESG